MTLRTGATRNPHWQWFYTAAEREALTQRGSPLSDPPRLRRVDSSGRRDEQITEAVQRLASAEADLRALTMKDASRLLDPFADFSRVSTDNREYVQCALRRSEASLRLAMETAELGHWEMDLATHHAQRSLRHDQIFGYDALLPEWTYKIFLSHVHPEDQERVSQSFREVLYSGEAWDFECRIIRADGEERWIWARGTILHDERGKAARALGVVSDISERMWLRKELEQALEREQHARVIASEAATENARLFQEATEASRVKSAFLAAMSHELRNPLNAIVGYVEILALGIDGPLTDAQRKNLDRIRDSQQHLLSLIDDVLCAAKAGSGVLSVQAGRIEVEKVLDQATDLIQPLIHGKEIHFNRADTDPDLTLSGDIDRIRQILMNVIGNSVKFIEPGGFISLSADRKDDRTRIHVRDTGRGIPAESLESIFHPFVQLADSDDVRSGVGLGLAISRDLAHIMGGDLTVESEEGAGSTFTLSLPPG